MSYLIYFTIYLRFVARYLFTIGILSWTIEVPWTITNSTITPAESPARRSFSRSSHIFRVFISITTLFRMIFAVCSKMRIYYERSVLKSKAYLHPLHGEVLLVYDDIHYLTPRSLQLHVCGNHNLQDPDDQLHTESPDKVNQ